MMKKVDNKANINKLKNIVNAYKIKDNSEFNKKKVKKETIKYNPNNNKLAKKEEILDEKEYPKQVMIKLTSMEGEDVGNEMTVPIQITTLDLNIMMNKIKKLEETTSYIFLIDDIEIKHNLIETIKKLKNFSSEDTLKIVYRPESLFSVKALTRASSTLEGHTDSILACVFSPNGQHLASGGGDCIVRLWDTETETSFFNCEGHINWVQQLAFSPCNSFLASGSVDGVFIVWDPLTGKALTRNIKAHNKWITSLVWKPIHLEPECKILLTAGKDGFFKVWDFVMQTCILNIGAHESSITKAIWSGENFIYTCSQDKLVKVWDESGNNVQTLKGHAHWINTMTINTEFLIRTGGFDDKKINFENKVEMSKYAAKRYNKMKEASTSIYIYFIFR